MRILVRLTAIAALLLACTALAVPKGGPRYETDAGTVNFLRRYLVSGGDIHYPLEAAQGKKSGSGFYLMKLSADGSVESITAKRSTGYKELDEHVIRTLKAYRFKPKTKAPLLWLVSFAPPATVIVKASVVRSENDTLIFRSIRFPQSRRARDVAAVRNSRHPTVARFRIDGAA